MQSTEAKNHFSIVYILFIDLVPSWQWNVHFSFQIVLGNSEQPISQMTKWTARLQYAWINPQLKIFPAWSCKQCSLPRLPGTWRHCFKCLQFSLFQPIKRTARSMVQSVRVDYLKRLLLLAWQVITKRRVFRIFKAIETKCDSVAVISYLQFRCTAVAAVHRVCTCKYATKAQ